jgi:aminopeptidase N
MPCCQRASIDRLGAGLGERHESDADGATAASAASGLALAAEFATPSAEAHYAPDLGIEPEHLQISLLLDLAARRCEGDVVTTVVGRDAEARGIQLDAIDFQELQVEDADGHPLSFSYDGRKLDVSWDAPPGKGERRRLRVRYRVERPITGMLFSWPEEAYPERPRFVATDHETERARYWLPCVDHPSVRTRLDFALRADASFTALANGAPAGEELHEDGTKTSRWHLPWPCPSYLVCLAVGDFVRADGGVFHNERSNNDGSDGGRDLPIAFFAPSRFAEADLARSFGRTKKALEWMTAKLDSPFPFPKYFQFAVPGIGGAMENISLVSWDDAWVQDERLHAERGWVVDLVNVHEMAHSWFGDAVVSRDFSHVWLKESWATYMESCWLEDQEGKDALHYQLHEEHVEYTTEVEERYTRPIVTRRFDSSWDMYDRHLYPGGAWRLHMLRSELGDAAFWAGVRDYVRTFRGRTVETDDFRRCLEAASGRSLARFFEQWFNSPGHPKLKCDWRFDRARGEGLLSIEQMQADDKKGIPLFRFPLDIALEEADGSWRRARIEVREKKQVLVVPMTKRPQQIVLDPDCKCLFSLDFHPGDDLARRTLEKGPTVRGRLQAVRSLAKSGSLGNIRALQDAYGKEKHWGVRREMARQLGEAGTAQAAQALAELLAVEQDPRVMSILCAACGKYREPALADALLAWLKGPQRPYFAQAQALEALGRQRGDACLPILRAAADDDSWWGWVRRGAMAGLGHARSEAARAFLMGRVAYGADPRHVRVAAVEALGEAARFCETGPRHEALDRLSDLARDPEYPVRMAVARGLRQLGEPVGAGAIDGICKSLADQDVPRTRKEAATLRRDGRGMGRNAALEKRVEDLEDKLRKLEQRLQGAEARGEAAASAAGATPPATGAPPPAAPSSAGLAAPPVPNGPSSAGR